MQSELSPAPLPAQSRTASIGGLHVAITMDGNGRWAQSRRLPRLAGHRAGAHAVRRIVRAAPACGIRVLTLFAFSADNWRRPPGEVDHLMRLFERYLLSEQRECLDNGVAVEVIGRRDRLPRSVVAAIEATESATAAGHVLHLRLAVDYSARESLLGAARGATPEDLRDVSAFARRVALASHSSLPARDVDLAIRTSGEQRLSDFLLWECAYAELYFTSQLWPDFTHRDLEEAVAAFRVRERRFGGVGGARSAGMEARP